MKIILPFEGMSQYESSIDKRKQGSACGPVTAASILNYHEPKSYVINELYSLLGTTRIGLFTWRMLRNFRKLGESRYAVKKIHSIEDVKNELLEGRPVAMKFDRYFSFRWFSKPLYNYHWVPLIGFQEKPDDLILYIHDNGKRNRPSRIRTVSYKENQKVLSFVKIVPVFKD